jgi:protease PrsW
VDRLFALTGAIPAAVAMAYVDRLDHKRPEPVWSLRRVALGGAVSVFACALLEGFTLEAFSGRGVAWGLARATLGVAAVEEMAKLLCVRWLVWSRPEFDERMDGIVYGTRAGLGFALAENVLYLVGIRGELTFAGIYVARALLTVPMHAVCGGIIGYFAACRRFDRRGPGMLGGYGVAVAIHGLFDGAVFVASDAALRGHIEIGISLLSIPLVIALFGVLVMQRLAQRALDDDDDTLGRLSQRLSFAIGRRSFLG